DGRGQGGGLADRAAGVRAHRQGRLKGGPRRGAAAARAARPPVQVPRVAGGAVCRVLRRTPHRELVHVRLAEDRNPGGPQLGGEGGVVRRTPALEDLRPARRGHVGGGEHVLQRQRNPRKRGRQRLTGRNGRVDAVRGGQRLSSRDVKERVVALVGVGNLVQAGLGDLARRRLLGRD